MRSRPDARKQWLLWLAGLGLAVGAFGADAGGSAAISTGAGGVQNQPALASSDTAVVAAWHQAEPGGPAIVLGWLDPASGAVQRQSFLPSGDWAMNPSVTAAGNGWAAAWQERTGNGFQVQAAGVAASGAVTWGPVTVSLGNGPAFDPAIAAAESNLAIAWFDLRNGVPGVYFTVLGGSGTPVAAERLLSRPGQAAHYPAVTAVPGGFAVAWHELENGQPRVFVQRFSARGDALGAAARVEGSAPSGWYPALAASADGFAVAFHAPGDEGWEVRLQRFAGTGIPAGPVQVLSAAGAQAMNASLAWDGQQWIAAWTERAGDTPQSRFAKVGAAPGSAPVDLGAASAAFPQVTARNGVFWNLSVDVTAEGEQLRPGQNGRTALEGEVAP